MSDRYLGSGYVDSTHPGLTGPIPEHLPARLTISLWDFSWYTRAEPGGPYADLDAVCAETAALGYNTIRICAAPLLLVSDLDLDHVATNLEIEGLGPRPDGGYFGQGTRWYDCPGGYTVNLHERLIELFDAAAKHGLVIILASWEYQQSPSFARSDEWFRAIDAVALEDRYALLAKAWNGLIDTLTAAGHRKRIALVELHNEVDFSVLPALEDGGSEALLQLRKLHPDLLVTASFGKPPHLTMHELPAGMGAAQFHVYSYGVLDALQKRIDIRSENTTDFPNAELKALLRPSAPSLTEYGRAAEWKYSATVVTDQMLYGYDWIDADAWDTWLYDEYDTYREVMRREIESRAIAIAGWARWQHVPAIIGEGWIGYTPLRGNFEEGPVGRELAEHGIRTALDHGVWGMVLSSNAAPHHPFWVNKSWQHQTNSLIRTHDTQR